MNLGHGLSDQLASPRLEAVASAAHRADGVSAQSANEPLAQPANVHIYGTLIDVDLIPPHAVEQLAARESPSGRLHEEFEQPVVGRAQMDRLSTPQHRH